MSRRSRLDAPAPGAPDESRRQRHVHMLTNARDRLRTAMTARDLLRSAPNEPVQCRQHGLPWTTCPSCSTTRSRT